MLNCLVDTHTLCYSCLAFDHDIVGPTGRGDDLDFSLMHAGSVEPVFVVRRDGDGLEEEKRRR